MQTVTYYGVMVHLVLERPFSRKLVHLYHNIGQLMSHRSVVIDHLEMSVSDTMQVVYHYFDYKEQTMQTPFNVVACLLRQIISFCAPLPSAVTGLCRRLKEKNSLPGWEELIQILINVCQELRSIVLIFDALDECDEDTNRRQILRMFGHLIRSPIRVLVTSRSHCLDINATFQNSQCHQIKVEATEADIQELIVQQISESSRMSPIIKGSLLDDVVKTLVENSQGM